MATVSTNAAVDDGAGMTVGNVSRTFDLGDNSSGKIIAGVDVTIDMQVLNSGTVN
jgi:hypothetical protein